MGIEKIGLPAKPAAKGAAWVLDASSCQTCQTPFSLFIRKHHCRRCGGIFCGNCSSSKVILRGQGDSAVRVCEPCKKLEEAARFQARNRGKKGALKGSSAAEDDALLKEALGDGMHSLISGGSELVGGEDDGHHEISEVSPSKDKIIESKEENTSPEKLREQASEQKKIYYTLKREGKNAEALQAFKRHKEFSREADALELSLKKLAISQRKAHAEAVTSTDAPVQKSNTESPESAKDAESQSSGQERAFSRHVKEARKLSEDGGDDDLLSALKDLGWNEADLSDKKVKKGPASDMELLAEISDSVPKDESKKKPVKQNPTQLEILAHKRRALALKREGNPAEAKEELKKAKLLERKLEEMALLEDEDEDEDDDDELAALMRSLNKEASMGIGKGSKLTPTGGDIDIPLTFSLAEDDDDPNVDVTDDDIHDPSIIAALRSMGWEEEAANMERSRDPQTGGPEAFHIADSVAKESSLQSEILTHKRRALALKREGKIPEAKIELQEAKVLEQKLEVLKSQPVPSQPIRSTAAATSKPLGGQKGRGEMRLEDLLEDVDDGVEVDEDDMRDPEMMAALKAMGFEEEEPSPPLQTIVKPGPLEKKNLQDEILSIKRSALALKKQGRVQEAREELRQAKILEQKLDKMQQNLEASGLQPTASAAKLQKGKGQTPIPDLPLPYAGFVSEDEEEEVEVGADDSMDPELVAALKSVGWQEEDTFVKDKEPEKQEDIAAHSAPIPVQPYKPVKLAPKDHARKLQLQKDLLAHKRRALALKREGKEEEAELELKQGKVLEKEMQEIDNAAADAAKELPKESVSKSKQSVPVLPSALGDESDDEDEDVTDEDMQDPELLNALKSFGWKPEPEKPADGTDKNTFPTLSKEGKSGLEKKDHSSGHKLDVANPPYTKTATGPTVDPIWHAIMKSSSMNHSTVPDEEMEETKREDPLLDDQSFEGEYGEIGSTTNLFPPLFDHPSSVPDAPVAKSRQAPSFDLLSGETWDAPAENVLEKDDSDEEDDVFDSGLLAALQSIGLGPPPKDRSSVQLPADAAANDTRQGNDKHMQETESAKSGGRQQKHSVLDQTTNPGSVLSSASGRQDREVAVGRSPVPSKSVKSVSSDHDEPSVFNEAAGPRPNSQAPTTPGAVGAATPSLQEEIKMLKRNALALKREGKTSEAREELRRAKILEKQMETGTQSSTEEHQSPDGLSKSGGTSSSTTPEKPSQTVSPDKPQAASSHAQTHKEQVRQELRQGKDRKKLQQESLAHKRKALGLRREGKIDEADAEFELAKVLEKQMEDLDAQSGKAVAQDLGDMGMVETLLDPQLMAALKGLGFNDMDHGSANANNLSVGPSNLQKSNQQPHPQAVNSSTNKPPTKIPTSVNEKSAKHNNQESQSREGRSASTTVSGNKVKEELIADRSSQPIQSTGGRSASGSSGISNKAEEERAGVRRGSQRVDLAPDAGRSTKGGAGSTSASASQAERKQLEDRIKREKVKAVELKRAGRQGEALEVLRGAKRLEKDLLAMGS
ncbi:unnamed protein product [Calypogeia fissa]